MAIISKFRVNYYVGALLAQGGNLWIEGSKVVFSPTSALDRAMGAKDVEIPFQNIRSIKYSGALSRAFTIATSDKVHKFEGAQAKVFWDMLEKSLPDKVKTAVPSVSSLVASLACDHCSRTLAPGYSFCPHCANRLKSGCSSCHRSIDPRWSACAFCGWKFTANPQNNLPS